MEHMPGFVAPVPTTKPLRQSGPNIASENEPLVCSSSLNINSYNPLFTNKDVSLIMRGRLYSSCVRGSMLHGSETWPVRKENVVALQRAEIRYEMLY